MKRYLSFLLSILLICSVVSACNNTDTSANTLPDTVADEISDATDALTEVLTDTDDEIETSAESKVENETETETEAETEPELESEPDPVAALPPRQVLKSLSVDATPLDISTVCKQISFSNLEFSDVQNAFLKEGYIVASTRRVQSSKLQTTVLKSLGHIVTLMQTDDGTMHVLWEVANEVSVDPLYMDPNMVKGDVTMVQIGIARGDKDDNPMIGMCYVYRLADGTALIIDGGNNNEPCAQNVYATLQKMDIAKDENGKYRITAWIFSHGHGDHYGTFKKFASLYADTTDLAYTFYSFPVGDIAPGGCNAESFAKIISEAYPNAKRVSPHAGLKYYFGNLTVHVLYAPELLYTTEAGVDYYNITIEIKI